MKKVLYQDKITFWYLVAAYLISMAYQYYRYTLHQHPADTFGTNEIVGYAVFLFWSALTLVERKWALKAINVLCAVQLSIGIFYYFPIIFRYRHDTFWDWAEAILFVLLIALAGYRSFLKLSQIQRQYTFG